MMCFPCYFARFYLCHRTSRDERSLGNNVHWAHMLADGNQVPTRGIQEGSETGRKRSARCSAASPLPKLVANSWSRYHVTCLNKRQLSVTHLMRVTVDSALLYLIYASQPYVNISNCLVKKTHRFSCQNCMQNIYSVNWGPNNACTF